MLKKNRIDIWLFIIPICMVVVAGLFWYFDEHEKQWKYVRESADYRLGYNNDAELPQLESAATFLTQEELTGEHKLVELEIRGRPGYKAFFSSKVSKIGKGLGVVGLNFIWLSSKSQRIPGSLQLGKIQVVIDDQQQSPTIRFQFDLNAVVRNKEYSKLDLATLTDEIRVFSATVYISRAHLLNEPDLPLAAGN